MQIRRILPALLAATAVASPIAGPTPPMGQAAKPAESAADYGDPIPGLTRAEEDLHVRGRRLFRWELWRPDRSANGFNATECSKCHLEPMFGGSNKDPKTYVAFVPNAEDLSGWKTYHRLQRNENRRFVEAPIPEGAEMRRAPSLYGLGLLEAVPTEALRKLADPADSNKDGISGRFLTVDGKPGRFGWKGHIGSIEAFVIAAFKGELGMSVEAFERDDFGGLGIGQIKAVTFYARTISPPQRPKLDGPATAGKALFEKIGCATCHTPKMATGESAIEPLKFRVIEAYTDMLLHDLSEGGDLHAQEPRAGLGEYRTPALWGVGSFGGPYWHDGSAPTLDAAIRKHSGEAEPSRKRYEALPARDSAALLEFLRRL